MGERNPVLTSLPDAHWPAILEFFANGVRQEIQEPADLAPSPEQFAEFVNGTICPLRWRCDAWACLNSLLVATGDIVVGDWPQSLAMHLSIDDIPEDQFVSIDHLGPDGVLICYSHDEGEWSISVEELYQEWTKFFHNQQPIRWFLIPLLRAWYNFGRFPPERRKAQILPESVRDARSATNPGAPLSDAESTLLGRRPAVSRAGGLPSGVIPALPLQVGSLSTADGSAPVSIRLWFAFQMSVPIRLRTGIEVHLAFTLREISTWLWPDGWNRRRHLPRLRQGMEDLYRLGVSFNRADWVLVRPVNLPTAETRLDDELFVDVMTLPGSDHGPMIDTAILWQFGVRSVVAWRIWIRLAYVWDQVKLRNGGHRIYATRPEVVRGQGGVILDASGRPVLRRNQQPVLDWSDSRAVRTGRQEPHPQANRVPVFGPQDLARLGYDDQPVPPGTLRSRTYQTRKRLKEMEEKGVVVLDEVGNGVRVLEVFPEGRIDGS